MKKVLVLLSTYNGEKYLKELMESLLQQKDVLVNILIRDDGSKDGTVSLLKKYNSKQITCVFGKNCGPKQSFFSLIDMAELGYDYYAFCDQDDVWLKEKLKVAVDSISVFSEKEPSLYYSGQILTDENLKVILKHSLDSYRSIQANFIFNQMAGCTAVFNLSMLKILKEYYPKKMLCHDVWLYKLCASIGGNIVVDSNGYILYRQHGSNVVGVDESFLGKLKRAKKYIFEYKISVYAGELLNGYESYFDEDWKIFINHICYCNHSKESRKALLKNKKIYFHNHFLKILFILKVFLRKM